MKTALILIGILLLLATALLMIAVITHWRRGQELLKEIEEWERSHK